MPGPITGQYFRAGVGAVIARQDGHVLVLERSGVAGAWQFPQGGLEEGEEPEQAVYREVHEEVGLTRESLELLDALPDLTAYELPVNARSSKSGRGQTQYWFYFALVAAETAIRLPRRGEFRAWRWAEFDDVVRSAVEFRRRVYARLRQHFHEQVTTHLRARPR
jgi:putative (di)nucleoside polyphosphate hydrolase